MEAGIMAPAQDDEKNGTVFCSGGCEYDTSESTQVLKVERSFWQRLRYYMPQLLPPPRRAKNPTRAFISHFVRGAKQFELYYDSKNERYFTVLDGQFGKELLGDSEVLSEETIKDQARKQVAKLIDYFVESDRRQPHYEKAELLDE